MENKEKYIEAGKIAKQVVEYAKSIIKPKEKLLDIAEKIESKIIELGAKPAFPVNLGINEIAAHYTPFSDDDTLASGLLKVDLGVHIDGAVADTAFSIDLENSEENKKLIQAAESALDQAIKTAKINEQINNIGKAIHTEITSKGFSPIRNLSGHEIDIYHLHAGITIPNYDNNNETELEPGVYAIEPFSTNGNGIVRDGKPSSIYRFVERKAIRDSTARKIIEYVEEEYQGLPFCQRWIVKKFGPLAKISLRLMTQSGILHEYKQLVEKGNGKVAQAEHTIIITKDKTEVTTQ
ncbi:MAG: type II methionyl aminopeptidase [Nanoarchaeota archaeon]|nr:type II methionyl aminopeptidase [Nanoarchaeota archaeon]